MILILCTYTGGDDRYYPSLGVHAMPGLVVELPELPADGRWETTPGASPTVPDALPMEGM